MYNRLTLVDGYTHKQAVKRMQKDHGHHLGFGDRNIRRYLPANNPNVPRRRIRTPCPKEGSPSPIGTNESELAGLTGAVQAAPFHESAVEQEAQLPLEQPCIQSCENKNHGLIDDKPIEREFFIPFKEVREYAAKLFKEYGDSGKVWFTIQLDGSMNVISARTGRLETQGSTL